MTWKTRPGRTGKWLQTVPADARAIILDTIKQLDPPGRTTQRGSFTEGWWVRLSPSSGVANDVVLLRRDPDGKVLFERQIVSKGKIVEACNTHTTS